MTELATDYAAADLTLLEHGVLCGLASLSPDGLNVAIPDLTEFAGGFCGARPDPSDLHWALLTLDALGWARPANDEPLTATTWAITPDGRAAIAGGSGA